MKRLALLMSLAALVSACGSSTTAPSSVPAALNLVGAWSGTATIAGQEVATGLRATNVCSTTWIVTTHAAGAVSGTYQLSGGTLVACAQAGSFSGTVSDSGATIINFGTSAGGVAGAGCVRVSGDSFLSGVSTASVMTLQQAQRLNCSGSIGDQTVTLSLTRR